MTRSEAPQSLTAFARECDPALRKLLDEKVRAASGLPVDLTPAFFNLRDYVLRGGKRLRGALCLLGCEAAGGSRGEAFPAAVGLELFHAYLLIHDDFMDRDTERRGGPTMHVALQGTGSIAQGKPTSAISNVAASAHVASSLAILLGSLCQAWALEQILASPVAPDRALAAAQVVARVLAAVTLGQALDLTAPLAPLLSRAAALRIEELKTGSYTFELPLTLGALLAGADRDTLAALQGYARPLGQAFQIADDLLGIFGSSAQTGKSAGNDLREGKRTLIVLHALETATPEDRTTLLTGLGNQAAGEEEVEGLREILRRSGAETFARNEAARLCKEAEAALQTATIPNSIAEELKSIARYSVQRDK